MMMMMMMVPFPLNIKRLLHPLLRTFLIEVTHCTIIQIEMLLLSSDQVLNGL